MKKITLVTIVTIFLYGSNLFANNPDNTDDSFFSLGKYWLAIVYDTIPGSPKNFSDLDMHIVKYTVVGDTIMNGREVKQIMMEDKGAGEINPDRPLNPIQFTYGYEENGIIYGYTNRTEYFIDGIEHKTPGFVPLYNQNLNVGDVIEGKDLMVTKIKTEVYEGIERKVWELRYISTGWDGGTWIEGIGTELDNNLLTDFNWVPNVRFSLCGCGKGEDKYYWPVIMTTTPDDVDELSMDNNKSIFYNLQGQRINNPVKGQLYIRHDGKKTTKVIY